MPVALSCRAAAGRPWRAYLRARGRVVLRVLGQGRCELSVSVVDDEEMRALNRTYRGRDRATDVLAFPLHEEAAARRVPSVRPELLGDVVISIDTAARQAHASRRPLGARLDVLLVHGILHLLGYDHERSPAEARRMARREREVRRALAAAAPQGAPSRAGDRTRPGARAHARGT
jgi:probable rRNA maturation factor